MSTPRKKKPTKAELAMAATPDPTGNLVVRSSLGYWLSEHGAERDLGKALRFATEDDAYNYAYRGSWGRNDCGVYTLEHAALLPRTFFDGSPHR